MERNATGVTLISNGLVLMPDFSGFDRRDLVLHDDRIHEVRQPEHPRVSPSEVDHVIDAEGKLIIPGCINAHTHSYAGLLKGSVGTVPLDIYMLYAIASGSARSERAMYVSTMIDAVQQLKNGVTSVVDHLAQRPVQASEGITSVIRAFEDSGMRALVAPMYSDKPFDATVPFDGPIPEDNELPAPAQSPSEYIAVCDEFIRRFNKPDSRVRMTLGTDGPQRCTDRLLQMTGELEEQHQCGWQTHVLEGKTQAIMSDRLYGKGLVEHVVEDLGLLNERTSLVHSVWLTQRETELVAHKKGMLVHCPRSNMYVGAGVAPVNEYRKAGITTALGTDGGNLGALEMFDVVRLTALLHRVYEADYQHWIDASDALAMMYRGGSAVMQRAGEIGVIRENAKADLVLLNRDAAYWWPRRDPLRQMVYYEDGRSVDTVLVDGKVLVENGSLPGVDERALFEEAESIAEELGLVGGSVSGPEESVLKRYREMYLARMGEDIGLKRFHG